MCLFVALSAGADVIFVDTDTAGVSDGSSWADAYNYLQDALAHADSNSSISEIRVAEGLYRPDRWLAVPNGSGDREAAFSLINGVIIKGGFAGFAEPDPNARDVEKYISILSGDLNGDDSLDFADNNENSYHVVNGSETDSNAVLDGFTITAGNADGISPHSLGGGMYTSLGSPAVSNCTFSKNFASAMGGGMFNYESCPTITNCTFSENRSDDDGGGIRNYTNSHAIITNCDFIANSAFEEGGGLNNRKNSNAIVTGCKFINNTAGSGGGMENHVGKAMATGEPIISNCTFIGNVANEGGGMRNNDASPIITNCTFVGNTGSGMNNRKNNPTVTNCIFWANTGGSFDGSGNPTVTYSNAEGGFPGTGNIDTDPLFADAANGYYHLKSQTGRWDANTQTWVQDADTSPCIDAGDPNTSTGGELYPNGGIVNMGAYGQTPQASASPSTAGNIADLNNDDAVDLQDFADLANRWNQHIILAPQDLNRDNHINVADLSVFSDNWLW